MFRSSDRAGHQGNTSRQPTGDPVCSADDRRSPGPRRIAVYLTIVALAAASLTGCGQPDRTASETSPGPSAFMTDDFAPPDFDALMLDEFP